jgi:stage V sporulation protein R
MGNNTVPGVKIHKEVRDQLKLIFEEVDNFGLDYYPTYIEFQTYDEISEIASYGGFPVRYPHWRFGMEYEELSRGI